MATVDSLHLNIDGNTKSAVSALNNLIKALKKFETEVSPERLGAVANGFKSINRSMNQLSNANISKVEKLANALEKISKSKVGSVSASVKSATATATKVSTSVAAATSVPTPVSDISGAIGEGVSSDVSKIEEATNTVSTLAKVAGIANKAISIVGTGIGILGKVISKVLSPITKFIKSLARVAFYRFIRGILKNITQGLKEGIQNLVLYSKALEGLDTHNANEVMSRYASAFLYFKNAIATAVMPVLRGLVPIIEQAMFKIVDFINLLAQLGSAFFGTEFTKAKYFWVDYADSLDQATGSAKALNHQLAGFDELNNLTDNQGGSGGAISQLDKAKDMFEEALINPKITQFVDKLKNKLTTTFNKVKDITKPFFDRVKEMSKEIKEKVYPNVKKIYDNVKKIWKEFVSPIIEEFLKGFFEGFTGEAFKNLPDTLATITDKVAKFTDKLVILKDKLPTEKIKDMSKSLGELLGKITGFYKPYSWAVGAMTAVEDHFKNLKTKCDKWADALVNVYYRVLDLNNPTSTLSEYLETLKTKFQNAKDQAKLFWDKLVDLASKILNVRDNAIALKNYFEQHKIFENGKLNAQNFLDVVNDIKRVVEWFQKLGKIVISFAIELTGGNAFSEGLEKVADALGLDDLKNDIANDVKGALKDTSQPKAQLPSSTQKDNGNKNAQIQEKPKTINDFGTVAEYQEYMKKKLNGYASGGFPTGDLFIANEKGAEMVGSIGGRTAVANNDEITEAIATATYEAMSKALSENNGSVTFVVEGDADRMFRVFQKKQKDYGKQTGLAY